MKIPSISIILFTLVLILVGTVLMYSGRKTDGMTESQAEECVDCVHYASSIDAMIQKAGNVQGNAQFFRYALDKSCRGFVLASGRCPKFRRQFLKDPERYMEEIQFPYEACVSIHSCQ